MQAVIPVWRSESTKEKSPSRALAREHEVANRATPCPTIQRGGMILVMISSVFVFLLRSPLQVCAQSTQSPPTTLGGKTLHQSMGSPHGQDTAAVHNLIHQVGESGRILGIAETASDRLNPPPEVAPSLAPVLVFRSLDRQTRYRLGRLDLVVDDAGH